MPIKIPQEIGEDERIVRCIGHEIYFSKSKKRIISPAFMPPKGSNEVSLLRLDYSDEHKCKAHAKSIKKGNYTYCGLSKTIANELVLTNTGFMIDEETPAETALLATPLDEEFNVRLDKENVTDEDPGLPYHADLVYNWTPEEGKTAPTAIKRLAKKLAKNPPTEYFPDKDVEIDEWTGSPMK